VLDVLNTFSIPRFSLRFTDVRISLFSLQHLSRSKASNLTRSDEDRLFRLFLTVPAAMSGIIDDVTPLFVAQRIDAVLRKYLGEGHEL